MFDQIDGLREYNKPAVDEALKSFIQNNLELTHLCNFLIKRFGLNFDYPEFTEAVQLTSPVVLNDKLVIVPHKVLISPDFDIRFNVVVVIEPKSDTEFAVSLSVVPEP